MTAPTVIASLPDEPMPFLGHSKGGSLVMHLANTMPHRVSHLVNLDGLPSDGTMSDVSEHERTRRLRDEMDAWLAHRRTLTDKQRRPGTIDELAERRGRMNPRLSQEWLRYLVTVGRLTIRTGGAGSSIRQYAWAASGRGGPSGRCCGCPASACR